MPSCPEHRIDADRAWSSTHPAMRYPTPRARYLHSVVLGIALLAAAHGWAQSSNPTVTPDSPSALERAYDLDAGQHGSRDAAGAAKLYIEAAAAGDAVAHLRLGYLYETGDGVPQDYGLARTHYEAAADAGLSDGHVHLGICYLEGWGVAVDRAAFVREIQVAAAADNVVADRILAAVYSVGLGAPRDEALALQWLDRAAKAGDTGAEEAMGRHAEVAQIRSLMHDETLARSWYQLSAEKDYADGMRAMARTFLTGPKRDRNWELGHRWLEMASDGGDDEAPYILAEYEIMGADAPTHDETRALTWLKLAAERHNEKATELLQLHEGGRSLDAAFRYMRQVPFEDRYIQRQLAQRSTAPTHRPIAYKVVKPVYPISLRMMRVEGCVIVDFIVDPTGRVQNPYALKSPHPLFSERAVRAVEQWRFYPGQKNGHLVNMHMLVPVYFRLRTDHLEGMDGLLATAAALAERCGPDVQADAASLMPAHAAGKLSMPTGPDGRPLKNARALILLVVDTEGVPVRGHILECFPVDVGAQILAAAMLGHYMPKREGDETVVSHQVLTFSTIRSEVFDSGLKN